MVLPALQIRKITESLIWQAIETAKSWPLMVEHFASQLDGDAFPMNSVILSTAIQGSWAAQPAPRKSTPTSDMVWTRVSNQLF